VPCARRWISRGARRREVGDPVKAAGEPDSYGVAHLPFRGPRAKFFFVDPGEVAGIQQREGAIGFDAPGATYPHRDARGRCSFETLAEEHRPGDAALQELGRIVHRADFADELHFTPESAGLRTVSHGFPLMAGNDHELVAKASLVYDALYASLRERHERTE
jgi:hypothetical protein